MTNAKDKIDLSPNRRERGPLHAAAAVSAALTVLALGTALFSRAVYDHVLSSHSMQSLAAIAGGMVIALMADATFRVMRSEWIEASGEAYDARLSEDLFRRLLRTRMSHMPRASQASTLFREFETVRDLNSTAVATAVVDAVSAALFLGVLFAMTGPLALVTALGMGAMLGAWFLQRAVERSASRAQPTLAARQSLLHESAIGAEDVKLARAEGRLAAEMRGLTETAAREGASTRAMGSMVGTLVQTAAGAVQSAVLVLGALLVIDGSITMGTLIAASILSGRAMAPCSALAGAAFKVGRARSAATAVRALADAPKEDVETGTELGECRGALRMEGVRFHYPGHEQPALDGFDLSLEPGDVVALLGPRGCGKSTLGRLLSGLVELDPKRDSGAVLLDGIPLAQISRASLRRHVGACPQDATLFSRSLRDNLALARPGATDDEVMAAARVACAEEWILRRPQGLDSPVVEQGRTLSGGERQSVGLARLFLSDPRVVFLDEPTAHFDPAATHRFVANMRGWLKGRTAVIATHRPEILAVCTKVAVMERGRVVAIRRPSEVLAPAAVPRPAPQQGVPQADRGAQQAGRPAAEAG